jgi:hypothetical protein
MPRWVARNERFREDGELRPASCHFRDQPLDFVHRLLAVEPDRSGLDDGSLHPHPAKSYARERLSHDALSKHWKRSILSTYEGRSARTPDHTT